MYDNIKMIIIPGLSDHNLVFIHLISIWH